MGLFDESEFSLLKEPTQYSNPTGRADPTVNIPAAPTSTGPGVWDIVQAGLKGALVGGASARDPIAFFRIQQMEQESKRRDQQVEMQKLTVLPNLMKMIEHIQDNVTPEMQADAIKTLAPVARQVFPEMDEKSIGALVGGSAGKVSDFVNATPGVAELYSPQEQAKLAREFFKNPAEGRKNISTRALQRALTTMESGRPVSPDVENAILESGDRKLYEERSGLYAVSVLTNAANDSALQQRLKEKYGADFDLKTLSRAELTKMVPGLAKANDDQLAQLNAAGFKDIKTKRQIERGESGQSNDIFVAAAKAKFPDDPQKQAEEVRRLRNNPESTQNILGNYLLERNRTGIVDPAMEQSVQDYQDFVKGTSKARAAGYETGRQGIRSQPWYQKVEEDIARLRAEGRTAGGPLPEGADAYITSAKNIIDTMAKIDPKNPKSLYKKEFVGPIRNYIARWQEKYGETEPIAQILGGAISQEETQFRNNAEFIFNELANLRGGKVLPKQELDRIEREAIAMFNSPTAFEARYEAFASRLGGQLQNKLQVIQSTRGKAGALNPATSNSGVVKLRRNPTNGKLEEIRE